MKILVVGSGGREHALLWKLQQSQRVEKLYCAPGNGGISEIASLVPIKADDLTGLLSFAKKEQIDLTVVGPELPLTLGIADLFQKEGLPLFGPRLEAARLEGSKAFTKEFLREEGIPTAAFEVFDDFEQAINYLKKCPYPIVLKVDGLAAGKGVLVAKTKQEAISGLESIFQKQLFGEAGRRVVIEEFLQGEEVSFLACVDGKSILPLDSSQDHKRAYDGDQGPNTGGMGAYSPAPCLLESVRHQVMEEILKPTLRGLSQRGIEYRGILYAGLMLTQKGPQLLEYNVRFGDPETQALMVRLEGDLVDLLEATVVGQLHGRILPWKEGSSVCIVMAGHGYPGEVQVGDPIEGLKEAVTVPETVIFHGGTKKENGLFKTAGGRVLGVTSWGKNLRQARERAYDACEKIYWKGVQFRRDIGLKGIKMGG